MFRAGQRNERCVNSPPARDTYVNGRVLRPRDGIIGISLRTRIFVNHTGARVLLAGQVLELGDACVIVFVRIIDHCDRLEPFLVKCLMLEMQRAIRQFAEAVIEELVDGPAVNDLPEVHFVAQFADNRRLTRGRCCRGRACFRTCG